MAENSEKPSAFSFKRTADLIKDLNRKIRQTCDPNDPRCPRRPLETSGDHENPMDPSRS